MSVRALGNQRYDINKLSKPESIRYHALARHYLTIFKPAESVEKCAACY